MNKKDKLRILIMTLRDYIKNGGMTSEVVSKATQELKVIGHVYDHNIFPRLSNTESFLDESEDSPRNLAEALLWKLGKWKSYKKFAQYYVDDVSKPSNTDVVFFAFARHLKDKNNPIYDQHAIRAMWAISDKLNSDEKNKCKKLLIDKKGKWKATGTGGSATDCYRIFLNHIDDMVKGGASKRENDLLLMPLGQALKEYSENYDEFCQLCGWNVAS